MAFVSTYTALVFSVESEEHRLFMPPTTKPFCRFGKGDDSQKKEIVKSDYRDTHLISSFC